MILEIIKDILFVPSNISEVTSNKQLKNILLSVQYPYLFIGMLIAGFMFVSWIALKFFKTILLWIYIMINSKEYK